MADLISHAGDTPYQIGVGQTDYKRLYRSKREIALTREITLVAGYGVIPQGAVLGKVVGGNRAGKFVPYNPNPNLDSDANIQWHGCRAYLVADSGTGQTVYTTISDSYKFAVGDVIVINSAGGTPYQLTITAIDRTTSPIRAGITFTGTISVSHTTANGAHICIDTENANTYDLAVGILEYAVDTGEGVNAAGGLGVMIQSNVQLYYGMVVNLDSAAITDISATADQPFLLIK